MCQGGTRSSTPPSASSTEIPIIARVWRSASMSVPSLKFPGTDLNIMFTLLSALFLMMVRLSAVFILQNVFGWPTEGETTEEAAASCAGIIHSSLLCPGLIVAFMSHRYGPSEHRSKAPKWWQELVEALLQFCTGYMLYDATFIIRSRIDPSVSWIPALRGDDYLFLGHHMATSTYMTQARMYQAGHMSAMMCMLLGEASNPPMNAWFVTSKALTLDCCNGYMMQTFHRYNEIFFCALYLFLRVIAGPLGCLHMSFDLLFSQNAKQNLPLGIRLFWNFMIWAVILGSYSWIVYTYDMLSQQLGWEQTPSTQQEL